MKAHQDQDRPQTQKKFLQRYIPIIHQRGPRINTES